MLCTDAVERTTPGALRLLPLLAAAAFFAACDPHGGDPPVPLNRFHINVSATDLYLVDTATGDLWRLDESPGDEPGHWQRAADAPGDARPWKEIVRPDENGEPPAEDHPEENQDGGGDNPDDGGEEQQDG